MKEYNIKILVDNDEMKVLFECDKEKNTSCKGNGNCRECKHTTNSRYAKAVTRIEKFRGKHVSDKDAIEELEREIEYYRDMRKKHSVSIIDTNDWIQKIERINKIIQEIGENTPGIFK